MSPNPEAGRHNNIGKKASASRIASFSRYSIVLYKQNEEVAQINNDYVVGFSPH